MPAFDFAVMVAFLIVTAVLFRQSLRKEKTR